MAAAGCVPTGLGGETLQGERRDVKMPLAPNSPLLLVEPRERRQLWSWGWLEGP